MNLNTLWHALSDHSSTIVLTPNHRLALFLQKAYQDYQQQLGLTTWETPCVLALETWYTLCWQTLVDQGVPLPRLLNSRQTMLLWQEIIAKSEFTPPLLPISATAHLAEQAWDKLNHWQVPIEAKAFQVTEETQAFYEWQNDYQRHAKQYKWMDLGAFQPYLREHLPVLISQKEIIFACFDELSPALKSLIRELGKHCKISFFDYEIFTANIQRLTFTEMTTEITAMVNWASQTYTQTPTASIACIVPDLPSQRSLLESAFTQVFGFNPPINFSMGLALNTYPIIFSALLGLKIVNETLTQAEWVYLFRSPFFNCHRMPSWGGHSLAARVQQSGKINLTKEDLLQFCATEATGLSDWITQIPLLPTSDLSLETWQKIFLLIFQHLGWPGNTPLTSQEEQTIDRWHNLLDEFASLSTILPTCGFTTAWRYLNFLASQTIFQTAATGNQIQILGNLEAAGLYFDYSWVMGLTADNWPAAAQPNPFIPLTLQHFHRLPHANAERELAFCQQLTHRLSHSAPRIVFSFSRHDGENEYLPSPLVPSFPDSSSDQPHSSQPTYTQLIELEKLEDPLAPPISAVEALRGGSSLLIAQANCPFQALATFRLQAEHPSPAYFGLDAKDRGLILHQALALIWQQLHDQANLLKLSTFDLTKIVESPIHTVLQPYRTPERLGEFYELENQRLQQLLIKWLTFEKQRPSFKVVAQESKHEIILANRSLHIRIDRIDELHNGDKLIIDYKTRTPNIKDCFQERLEKPQLPLYSLVDSKIVGVAYAEIQNDKLSFRGVSQYDLGIEGIRILADYRHDGAQENWPLQLSHWREQLTDLLMQHLQGVAAVDPAHPTQSCQYCQFTPLCRRYETE